MGSKCSCLKIYHSEEDQITTEEESRSKKISVDQCAGYRIEDIINLQRIFRGFIDRNNNYFLKYSYCTNAALTFQELPEKTNEISQLLTEFSNTTTIITEKRLGPYEYPFIPENTVLVTTSLTLLPLLLGRHLWMLTRLSIYKLNTFEIL